MKITDISSRDNALIKDIRKLLSDNTAYRKQGQIWIEGEHLCQAYLAQGGMPSKVLYAKAYESRLGGWMGAYAAAPNNPYNCPLYRLDFDLMKEVSDLESPSPMGFLIPAPAYQAVQSGVASVVLDRVQDAGNVGSILRCCAAFGITQVIALKGTVALWSPKVLRAGMGAHFALGLHEQANVETVRALQTPLLATSSHEGAYLHQTALSAQSSWLFGHEGQGLSAEVQALATQQIRIYQPNGQESLNVAAAAAVCLHASAVLR